MNTKQEEGYGEIFSCSPPCLPDARRSHALTTPIHPWPVTAPGSTPSSGLWPFSQRPRNKKGYCTEHGRQAEAWLAGLHADAGIEGLVQALYALAGIVPMPKCTSAWVLPDLAVLISAEFVWVWWRYVEFRWRVFGEWPDTYTQLCTLAELLHWKDPKGCVMQSVALSYKAVYPLQADLENGMYIKTGYALRTSRTMRGAGSRGNVVRDTVVSYRQLDNPSQSS